MSKNNDNKGKLLLELFSEEIPARMQINSEKQLSSLFEKSLIKRDIGYGSFLTFSSSRHLSIIINNLDLKQKNQIIEKRGPRVGSDKKAINGFLKSNNIQENDIVIKDTKNGKFYFYHNHINGINTSEVLPDIINEIIDSFVWPKSQRWAYSELRWARPLRNILLLLNNQLVEGKVAIDKNNSLYFSNYTFGHRHDSKKIEVRSIDDYESLLEKNKVILDRDKRRNKIVSDTKLLLKDKSIKLLDDDHLLDEILGLIEFPNVLIGSIDEQFMNLPKEVLTTAMRVHQKYFSIIDNKNNLVPKFLFVSNTIPEKERDKRVIEGNERVLKARLSDSNFFWKTDTSITIKNLNEKLKNVLFYEGLGSLYEKTIRLSKVSKYFSSLFNVDESLAKEASLLSKFDLVSEMVGEFPELQGIMGSYFTKLDGKSKEVSNAIFEHYKPKGISDEMPTTNLGGMLSMIDNIDTLTGFFIINKKPSGSKDPFALRRAGFSIVQILMKFKLNISISDLFTESVNSYKNSSKIIKLDLVDFIIDKVRFILKNQNFRDDIITSVFSLKDAKNYLFPILYERVNHINDVKDTSDFKLFLVNFKRLNNIIKSNKLPYISCIKVNPDLFETSEEKEIYNKSENLNFNLKKYLINLDYQKSILQEIINLQYAINSFFETVIVNHEEKIIKNNRIALLTKLSDSILEFSNFGLIED